jgi:hypothetical protein
MQPAKITEQSLLDLIIAVIAGSEIAAVAPAARQASLPAGFEAVDVAVLDWIAGEGRRIGRSFTRM